MSKCYELPSIRNSLTMRSPTTSHEVLRVSTVEAAGKRGCGCLHIDRGPKLVPYTYQIWVNLYVSLSRHGTHSSSKNRCGLMNRHAVSIVLYVESYYLLTATGILVGTSRRDLSAPL
jgi:hypothetical protein